MKKTKDQEQDFVLRHYAEGRFDPEAALKKLRPRPIRRRWVAAAASLLCIVAFASVLTWQLSKPKQPLPTPATESVVSTHEEPDVAHFSFMQMEMNMVTVALTNTLYRLAVVIIAVVAFFIASSKGSGAQAIMNLVENAWGSYLCTRYEENLICVSRQHLP